MKKVMKKVIAAMVSTAMLLPLAACGNSNADTERRQTVNCVPFRLLAGKAVQQVIPRHQKVGVQWVRTEWTTHRGSHLKSVLPPMHQPVMWPETESARLERE